MAAQDRPRLDPATARAVIDPKSYAEWDGLLDTFDRLREDTPVAWVEPADDAVHPPFWLVTRYDDVMRMSKDNATFLNNPHSVVFSLTEGIEFAKMVPGLWLPELLRNQLGYQTGAMVSLPVLNPRTGINRAFDSFELMDKHNDMRAMLPKLKFTDERPSFYMLNVGETHYPYAKPDEDSSMWPRISGVNGVFKKMNEQIDEENPNFKEEFQFFDQDKLDELRERQIDTVRYLDGVFEELYDMVPKNTHIIVTADHGELFGEKGYFGHGPIMHDKCFEVPYLEGMIR